MRLVGLKGIAALVDVKYQTVKVWRSRGVLPEPFQIVDDYWPVWWVSTIEEWAKETGRST